MCLWTFSSQQIATYITHKCVELNVYPMKFLTYQIPSTFLFIVFSTCLCFLLIFISQKINYGALCTFSLAHINIYTHMHIQHKSALILYKNRWHIHIFILFVSHKTPSKWSAIHITVCQSTVVHGRVNLPPFSCFLDFATICYPTTKILSLHIFSVKQILRKYVCCFKKSSFNLIFQFIYQND